MGKYDLTESDAPLVNEQDAIASGVRDNALTRSLRGGVLGARSQLSNLAGGVADAAGLKEAAASSYGEGLRLQQEAQLPQNSPRISSFKSLREDPSLSNTGEYLAGLAGGSLPMMGVATGAGILSGGRAVPAMLAGGAALTPFNTGEVLGRMQTDPQAQRMGAGERLARAGGSGLAASAVEGIVPGMVAGKVLGRGAGAAAGQSVKQIVGKNALDIPLEGLAEGSGEAIKQLGTNTDKPLDWEQIGEGAIGGAAAGGVFAGVGTGADLAHSRAGGVQGAIKDGATSIRERLERARAAATGAGAAAEPEAAPKKINSIGDDLAALLSRGREAVDDSADRVMSGQPLGDLQALAGAQGDRLKELVDLSDNETVKKVQEWGSSMLADAGLSPERKQAVAEAMANVGDRASQTTMAGLKKAYDAGNAALNKVKALRDTLKKRDVEGDVREVTTLRIGEGDITDVTPIKKSNDYSGANKAIADQLAPLLARSQPELAGNPDAMSDLADGVRQTISTMRTGRPSMDTTFRLIDALGDDTVATLTAAYKAVADADPAKAEGFYQRLNELADLQSRARKLEDFVAGALVQESQGLIKSNQMGELVQMLVARARGEGIDPNAGPNQRAAEDRIFRDLIATHFGDKADAVSLAIEKEAGMRASTGNAAGDERVNIDENGAEVSASEGGFDESGRRISAEELDVIRKGRGPRNEAVMDPDLFKARGMQGQNYAAQYIKDLQAKYPDRNVHFEKAEGTDGMGHVVAEKAADPDALSDADVQAMRLDKKYPNSKDKLKLTTSDGETWNLDTRRIAKAMKRIPRGEGSTDAQHLAKRFIEGLARLTEQHGTIDVSDNVVIGQIGNKDFTFGMAKTLDPRTGADKANDAETQELVRQREAYKDADPVERANLRDMAKETTDRRNAARDKELASEGDGRDAKDEGERGPGKDGEIQRVTFELGDRAPLYAGGKNGSKKLTAEDIKVDRRDTKPHDDIVNRSNMDGTPRHTGDRVEENRNALVLAVAEWGRTESAPAKAIANRAQVLLANIDKMKGTDRRRFIDLAGATPADASSTINDLARKYRDVIVLPNAAPKGIARKPDQEPSEAKKAPVIPTLKDISERLDYLLNPPGDFSFATAERYGAEATAQLKDVTAERDKHEEGSDKWGVLNDLRWQLKTMVGEAKAHTDHAATMKVDGRDEEGFKLEVPPSPKDLAAKKAAFLEAAFSSDPALLKELATSTDAKGLQRGAALLVKHISPNEFEVFDFSRLGASFGHVTVNNAKRTGGGIFTSTNSALIADYKELVKEKFGQAHEYDVKIDVSPEEILDLTKALSDQPLDILTKLRKELDSTTPEGGRPSSAWMPHPTSATLKAIYDRSKNMGRVREVLASMGVRVTHFSEADDSGAQRGGNYVLLDPKAVASVKRVNTGKALDTVNARLAELVQDPGVAYGLQTKKYSAQATGSGPHTPAQRAAVKAHIEKVLGQSVKKAWAKLTHAGEYDSATNTIRLSVHALDPLSTAYHESLHAFFAQLRRAGATDITAVLERAAETPHVLAQLTDIFAKEPAVLQQLRDPEERAAYMYQMWAAGKLTVGPQTKGVFRKIADYIRGALGIWSNDDRALHILEYFHSGEYAKNLGSPSAVRNALMAPGRNSALERAREMAEPLARLSDSVFGMGSARLRDTGIPALNDLANLIKREHTDASGKDQGFIAAARIERTQRINTFSEAVAGYTPEQLTEATKALQRGEKAASPEARLAQRAVKRILAETKAYMEAAGVKLGDLGPDYFPRVWDVHYISKNQDAFKQMLEPYKRAGKFTGSAESLVASLVARDGNEFGIETREPGMQHVKKRVLGFIDPKDAAEFVKPDLFPTMDSYLTQAARKAEWERRLGGMKLVNLLDAAKQQGATKQDLELADKYLRGVDGTLGDTMDPGLRRLSGNMLVYQNIRLLPLAVFSSIVDPVGVMVRGGTVGDAWATFSRGIREIPNTFKKDGGTKDEATELAELMGVIDTASLSHFMGDVYTQGMVGGTAQKINSAFFKYNLMEGFNRSFRVGATEAAIKFIAAHADGTRTTHSKRWIDELGLKTGDVRVVGGRMALTEADGLTASQATRVRAAVNQWVDGAILRPDAADKPIWMNDPRWALVAHLKQFIYSFQKTILARVAHEAQNGNYTPSLALAGYVPIMIAADLVKGVLQGGGDQPEWKKGWSVADHAAYGVQRAGLYGVGEFPIDAIQDVQRGGIGIGALVGPTVEQLADAVQAVGGNKEFSSFALKSMPANALYAEAVRGESSAN